jgi:hypothetical protein
VGLLLLFVIAGNAGAKARSSFVLSLQSSPNASYSSSVQALEERLTPYLQARISRSRPVTSAQNPFRESDLFLVTRKWSSLSTEFKQLYKEAMQIPVGYSSYVSPSGHFEVYYTTQGENAVDSADNYGFGVPGNWRTKNSQPNGVPDYVDEVAWDFDSAWSMEIGQFQYLQPIPYTDATHTSNRFKVVIDNLDITEGTGTYGLTIAVEPVGSRGWSSYIEIRNEWAGWTGTGFNYDTVPYNGARVTCSHEFFHTIQYAMARSVNPYIEVSDSFPKSWLEGTAVMMEGLAFRYVYDYIYSGQYAPGYFDNPTLFTILDPTDMSNAIYTNCLVTKFLHELFSPAPDNDFIRHVFFSDYDTLNNFYKILHSESLSNGHNWVDIMNAFHTQSFFTGSRAIPGVFIQDAPLLPQWSYTYDTFDVNQEITKNVIPYSMQVFAIQPAHVPGDTLNLVFQGEPSGTASGNYPIWSASCILERSNGLDSIMHFTFVNSTLASLVIPSWASCKDALVIATNGDIAASHSASVSAQTCPVTYAAGSPHTFMSATNTDTAIISLRSQTDLRCSLTVAAIRNDSLLAIAAHYPIPLIPLSGLYSISFPAIWSARASIGLAINSQSIVPATHYSLGLYLWNDSIWTRVRDSVSYKSQSLHDIASLVQPGIYGVFYSSLLPVDTANSVAVYPNPAHIRRDGSIAFRGKSLLELWIYSIDGTLVAHDIKGRNNQPRSVAESPYGFDWRLCSAAGTAVSPGVYFAHVGYKDPITKGMKRQAQKMFVVP